MHAEVADVNVEDKEGEGDEPWNTKGEVTELQADDEAEGWHDTEADSLPAGATLFDETRDGGAPSDVEATDEHRQPRQLGVRVHELVQHSHLFVI